MCYGVRRRLRFVLAIGLLAMVAASCSSSSKADPQGGTTSTTIATTTPSNPSGGKAATFHGALLARDETPVVTLGRDGGISVPLPNGRDFWVFGDTPTYQYRSNNWDLTHFIQGSSAGIVDFTSGQRPTIPVDEVVVGQPHSPSNGAAQFLKPPRVYLTDGSGKICNKINGGRTAGSVRWATGAALMPDKTNILVSYLSACVISATNFRAEGWGFALYNWKTNRFTQLPLDVFPPAQNGAAIPTSKYFGSPIVDGDNITFFSTTCCDAGSAVYTTTVPADVASLKNPASYAPHPILGLPPSFVLTVAPPSSTQPHLTMYELLTIKGSYRILTASTPAGPWTEVATGILPGCPTAPQPCTNSIYLHPELSSSSELLVSYYLYGYGPGIADHPDPSDRVSHIVFASLAV